jgi:predicted O-methyltransferase YrrM
MNRIYMAHWVANIVGQSPATCLKWFDELENDQDLRMAIREAVSSSPRRRIMDSEVEFGRRLAWYALVRSLKPRHVVETGTDRGLGTLVLASALIRNGLGAVTTIDTNPDSGDLIVDPWDRVISRRVGDSIEILSELKNIDLFIHDSDHSYGHEMNEFVAISQNLTDQSMVLSDNSQSETALLDWSSGEGRRFSYFVEEPNQFWAKGGAIGIAIPR